MDSDNLRREYDLFLRRYEYSVSMYEARFDTSRKMAGEYANSGLKLLSVLNGGAIVTVPALAQLFSIDGAKKLFVAVSIEDFAIGLIATAVAYLLAYLSLELDSGVISIGSDARSKQIALDYLKIVKATDLDEEAKIKEIQKLDCSARRRFRITIILQILAILSALVGVGSFIYGAYAAKAVFGF